MKLRTVIYSLLLATLCMGCGGSLSMRQLEQLEAQLDTAPDAVRLVLDSIPFSSLGDEERALYAILRTQALRGVYPADCIVKDQKTVVKRV